MSLSEPEEKKSASSPAEEKKSFEEFVQELNSEEEPDQVHDTNISSEATREIDAQKEETAEEFREEEIAEGDDHAASVIGDDAEEYELCSKAELVNLMTLYCDYPEINRVKERVNKIKSAFVDLVTRERNSALNEFLQSGGDKKDFTWNPDGLELKFFESHRSYSRKRRNFIESLEREKEENFRLKTEIINQLRNIIQHESNLPKALHEFHDLQARWRTIGNVPLAHARDLNLSYKVFNDKFYDLLTINRDLLLLDQKKNLEVKTALCEKAEELLIEPSIKKMMTEWNRLQKRWNESGPVPRDKRTDLWDRYRRIASQIALRRKNFFEEIKQKQQQSAEKKEEIIEKIKALNSEDYSTVKLWNEKSEEVQVLREEWKRTGWVAEKDRNAIWNRFREECDKFFKKKIEFYSHRKAELQQNLKVKTDLCQQAEALKDSTDWKTTTGEFIRLQKEWKNSGPVPERQSQKIWLRFRAACDEFFSKKAEYFGNIQEHQEENYHQKINLIERLENFEVKENNSENIEFLKALQKEWSDAGHVPIEKKEEVQSKYKKAIEGFYLRLRIDEKEISKLRYKEKIESLKQSPQSKSRMTDERNHLFNKISQLKNDVQLWENNIGFFAKSATADALRKQFEERIESARKEIEVLKEKLDLLKAS